MDKTFHAINVPYDETRGTKERVVSIVRTDEPEEVELQLLAAPGSIALQLVARDEEEVRAELGFMK